MRNLYLIIASILFLGCQQQSPEDMVPHLSGYWEIENVLSKHVKGKEFTFNNTIDYIELEGSTGIRTKLQPTIDGKYIGNKTAESFEIKVEADSLNMYYQTPFDSWKETVLKATDVKLIVRNQDGIEYHYKKFEPINLEN